MVYKVNYNRITRGIITFPDLRSKSHKFSLFHNFTYTIFSPFHQNSPLFLQFLCQFFICRCSRSSVRGNWSKNRANSNCCNLEASMAVWYFFFFDHCWAEQSLVFTFLRILDILFWQLEVRNVQEHELHNHEVNFRNLRFLKSACGLDRSCDIE
jgi:hypothetical protein